MKLGLKALDGAHKDRIFRLKDGLTLGRQGADIVLNDPKVSSIHARVVETLEGWTLEDNNSKNGIRVGEDKVASLVLKPRVQFEVGGFGFKVVSLRPKVELEKPDLVPVPQPEKKKKKAQKYWHEAIIEFLDAHQSRFADKGKPVTPLEPALILEFVKGVQANSKWTLGYGPRKIGSSSLDLPIWEPGAPSTCFELQPTVDGILFITRHPEIVKINGDSMDSKLLHMGDTIQILDTLIEVDFSP